MFVRRDDDGRFGRLLLLRGVLQGFCLTRPPGTRGAGAPFLTVTASATSPPFGEPATEPYSPRAPRRERGQEQEPPGRETRSSARDFGFCHRSMPPQGCVGSRPTTESEPIILRHTEMSAANVSACLHAKPTFMWSGPPSKARLMPSQKLALAFSQSIPIQRLRRNAAVRLLETEGRDSAAYASNSAVSYHILSRTIQARSTTAATHGRSRHAARRSAIQRCRHFAIRCGGPRATTPAAL